MSDRTTYWLTDSYTRHQNFLARQRKEEREEFIALADLVIEVVHPGNLGVLPPSPAVLRVKARQIGLI